jgi:hypothetical protein
MAPQDWLIRKQLGLIIMGKWGTRRKPLVAPGGWFRMVSRPPGPSLRSSEGAATPILGFLIAGVIFVGSIGSVLMVTRTSTNTPATSAANVAVLGAQAKAMAGFLVGSPGYASDGGDWAAGGANGTGATMRAENLSRLGLLDGTRQDPTLISYVKLENLRHAPLAANPTDGYVNYPEAKRSLGLGDGVDFHVRAYPTLASVQACLRSPSACGKDQALSVAYIGHVNETARSAAGGNPAAGLGITAPTCSASPLPNAYRLTSTVYNNGTTSTQFVAAFEGTLLPVGATVPAVVGRTTNSFLVAPSSKATLSVDIPAILGRACGLGSLLSVTVVDQGQSLASATRALSAANAASGVLAPADDYYIETTSPYTLTGQQVTLRYDGSKLPLLGTMMLKVYSGPAEGSPGSAVYSVTFTASPVPAQRTLSFTLPAGQYTAALYDGSTVTSGTQRSLQSLLVTSSPPAGYTPQSQDQPSGPITYTAKAGVGNEVAMIDSLVQGFCPTYQDSKSATPVNYTVNWRTRCSSFKPAPSGQYGDVFPDGARATTCSGGDGQGDSQGDDCNNAVTQSLAAALGARLHDAKGHPTTNYTNTLVVGSNVDHAVLSASSAKWSISDWVTAGGVLVVFGSDAQRYTWLEPIYHAMIQSSSGGIASPDAGHPVLNTPDVLDWGSYSNRGQSWVLQAQPGPSGAQALPFTNVVLQGAQPILTLSNPGAIGGGKVILTTWRAYDVYNGQRDPTTTFTQGRMLMNNLLMQQYQDLFLDYGPPLPAHADVVPSLRTMQVWDPAFAQPVQVTFLVYTFT